MKKERQSKEIKQTTTTTKMIEKKDKKNPLKNP